MTATTASGGVRFGGSGFGPDYFSVRTKRKVDGAEDGGDSASQSRAHVLPRGRQQELEQFLFTVKEPIRSALNQLMLLIKDILEENPVPEIEKPEIISGPLGYTSLRAVRPITFNPTRTVFRPVLR